MHVAAYLRISSDRDDTRLGVNLRQLPDCQALHAATDLAHLPLRVYEDNDTSASRRGGKQAVRPAFTRLLTAIGNREVAAVFAWVRTGSATPGRGWDPGRVTVKYR